MANTSLIAAFERMWQHVVAALGSKSDVSHIHDDRYYTETEIDAKFEAIPTPDVSGQINTHNTNTSAHADIRQKIDSVEASIPDALSDLTADSTHRTVTDTEKATWNAKSDFSGNYNDLTNKPSIPSIAGLATTSYVDEGLAGKSDTTHNHDSAYDAKGSASAVQSNLDTVSDTLDAHTEDSDIHVTTTNKTNWNAAHTHSTSAHARVDATKVADSTTNGNILINDTETNVYSHPNSGVSAGTYKSVTVDSQGHITSGSNPTTLAGYGITDAETKSDASAKLTEAKTYADNAAANVKNDLLNGAGGAYDTLKELGDLIDENVDAIDALETVAASKADASALTSHTGNTNNPHNVTAAQVGAVPASRTINGKALSEDIALGAADVGAVESYESVAELSSAGWYRVCEVDCGQGSYRSGTVKLFISGAWGGAGLPTAIELSIALGAYTSARIIQMPTPPKSQHVNLFDQITKVRVCQLMNNPNRFAVDVYYKANAVSPVSVVVQPSIVGVTMLGLSSYVDGIVTPGTELTLTENGFLGDITAADVGAPTVDEMNTAIANITPANIGAATVTIREW